MTNRRNVPLRGPFPDVGTTPLVSPIYPSVVYTAQSPDALDAVYEGEAEGYTYARDGHPNADALAARIDALEGVAGGIVVGSGMAAVTLACLSALTAGDHVLAGDQLYGRSLRLMGETLPRFGIETELFDSTDASAFEAKIRPETKLVLAEVVSNPTIRVADIEGIVAVAKAKGILVVVDNTFTTPAAFKPYEWGADMVIHSVTKLLSGHSDTTLGYLHAKDAALMALIETTAVTMGLTPSPFDCWLAERGLLTFQLRYDRAQSNAAILADALADMTGVSRVLYPQRSDHPDHNRALGLLGENGSTMVSFQINGERDEANRLVEAASTIAFAPTLGDIVTTLSHPPSSSHRALTPQARARIGITEGFFRVSVGCEDIDALIGGFETAVNAAAS